jgi:coenzyme F420-0:L-glutamate ligase / coenzyme F420-1:gamma-L-glutamate ligase
MGSLSVTPLPGIGEIQPGDDLALLLSAALHRSGVVPTAFDVLVVAQKAVSKAENRYVPLTEAEPSPEALRLAQITRKDPRLIQLVLGESTEVLRAKRDVLIVRHRLGFVMANAGIDRSNVPGTDRVLLLPRDPEASAQTLRARLTDLLGVQLGVVICDSFGRPWRKGVTNVALGSAGLPALIDRRGELDRNGRPLEVTEIAFADLIASAAGLVMGEASEGVPAALLRGLTWVAAEKPAASLLRPLAEDLFR